MAVHSLNAQQPTEGSAGPEQPGRPEEAGWGWEIKVALVIREVGTGI